MTFTNTKRATLIVKKVVINDDGGTATAGDFSFQYSAEESFSDPVTFDEQYDPLLGENHLTVNAGSYIVTEPAVEGYTTTYEGCTGMVIANLGEATCTITNNDVQSSGGGGSSSGSRRNQGQVLGATTGTCLDPAFASQQVPLYRFWNLAQTDHMYSTSSVAPAGFVSEGIVGNVYQNQVSGSVALYGLYNATTQDHFYTTSASEATASGYASLGIVGYVYEASVEGSHQVFRMWNGAKTDHFYTFDAMEVNDATTKLGYQSETFSVYLCGQTTTK